MKPFILLITSFTIAILVIYFIKGTFEIALCARISMSIMLIFTAVGHFLFTNGMALMIPDFIPFKKEWVYITAFIEIAAAIGLQISQLRTTTAWLLILFLILILPANIKASIDHLDYQKASFDGKGLTYLWFRIPLQLFYITWVYISCIR